MRHIIYIGMIAVAAVTAGCTGTDSGRQATDAGQQPKDTVYTRKAAMSIYGYQPLRALQIIDSALIVGNIGEVQAEQCRARIYGMSLMTGQLDSLLGGPADVRLDTAQAIGERLLSQDSIKGNLLRHRDVLEILAYVARKQSDTQGWIERSLEIADVCRKIGPEAETDALRTEAEIGAAYHETGRHEEGMAKLDSVIAILSKKGTFDELDALIIALKRKIAILGSHGQYAATLPLAREIIERLDDYEAHPDQYHDGSHREPATDEKRADYIRFYRSQAQNYMTAAHASINEHGNMLDAFTQIENSVHDATAREHQVRYDALLHKMRAERERTIAGKAKQTAVVIGIFAILILLFAAILIFLHLRIRRKNRALAQQIADAVTYKEKYRLLSEEIRNERGAARQAEGEEGDEGESRQAPEPTDLSAMTDEQMYRYIDDIVIREHLFTDPYFGRETIMERFHLSKERVGAIFSKGSEYAKMSSYVLQLRLDYAARLLLKHPDKSIVQIASESGFSSSAYFGNCFRHHFGMTPTEYRREAEATENE